MNRAQTSKQHAQQSPPTQFCQQKYRAWCLLGTGLLGFVTMFWPGQSIGAESPSSWELVLSDSGTGDWSEQWFKDGSKSTITNTPEGMIYQTALADGPDKDEGHEVLWTKASFKGDVRVEYDFTRLDSNLKHVSVCILYLHATGRGGEQPEDISLWMDQRSTPQMARYFRGMKLYHISYACTGGEDNNYIRARQYPTKGNFVRDTLIEPSFENVDLFKPGETWHLVFEKTGSILSFTASKGEEVHQWQWDLSGRAPLHEGRIGLRQMRGRESKIANFKVFRKVTDSSANHPR